MPSAFAISSKRPRMRGYWISLKLYCWQRERIVAGILWYSVVARINTTRSGGSSRVLSSAAKADADPDEDLAANVNPVTTLIKTCRQLRVVPTVLFAGTATECGLTSSVPVNEFASDHPITMYDRHKLMAEKELEQADKEGVLRGVTLRMPNLYGPGPRSSSADWT